MLCRSNTPSICGPGAPLTATLLFGLSCLTSTVQGRGASCANVTHECGRVPGSVCVPTAGSDPPWKCACAHGYRCTHGCSGRRAGRAQFGVYGNSQCSAAAVGQFDRNIDGSCDRGVRVSCHNASYLRLHQFLDGACTVESAASRFIPISAAQGQPCSSVPMNGKFLSVRAQCELRCSSPLPSARRLRPSVLTATC